MKQEKAPGMTCTLGDCPMYRDCVAERLDCAAWAALAAEREKVAEAVAVLKSRDDLDGWPGVVEAAIFILTAGKGKAEPPLTAAQVQAWLTAQVERAEDSGRDDVAMDLAQAKLLIRRLQEKGFVS